MASYHDVVQRILALKSKLSNNPLPETPKIIKLLEKLTKLPVNVEILQETRIGKCVNGLKKKCPELAAYVKPLINSWKSVVRMAMLEEEKQMDPVQENGDVSETNEEDGFGSSPPGTPGTSPNIGREENDNYRTGRSFTYSPSPEEEDNWRESSHERQSESQNIKNAPPTPIPWSPEKKIFPPFVPRKERQKEKTVKHIDLLHGNDLTNKKKREKGDSPERLVKSRSDLKDTSRMSPSLKSRERFSESEEHSDINRNHDSLEKSKVLPKEAIDQKLQSLHGVKKKKKTIMSNVLLNDKLSSGSHSGIKRTARDGTDKAKTKSLSETSHSSKDSKKISTKSNPLDDATSLFKPDAQKAARKSSKQRREISSGSGREDDKGRLAGSSDLKNDKRKDEGGFKLSEQAVKKRIEHKKKVPSSSAPEIDDGKSGEVSDKTISPKVSSSGKSKIKSQTNKSKAAKNVSSKIDSSTSSDDVRSSDTNRITEERSHENTGMSFEDCLFGGAPVMKKKKASSSDGKHNTERRGPAKHDGKSSSASKSGSEKGRRERSDEMAGSRATKDGKDRKPKKRKPTDESGSHRNSEKRAKESSKIENEVQEASASEVEMSLPDIDPDYKPAPRLPEFKQAEKLKMFEPKLAPQQYGSKQTKTKVYSGKARKRHWKSLPSLQDICKEVIFDNIEALYDTGGVPFYILEDVLEKCTAQQLLKIEDYNPDYILESDHFWKGHAERTFKGAQQEEMENWRELYLRKMDEREYKFLALKANILTSMAKKDTGRLTKLAFVDKPVKPPRSVIRQQMRHGTTSSSVPSKAPRPRKEIPGEEPSHRIIPNREPPSPVRRHKTAKVKAPMMQKSLKMMKRVNSRR